MIEKYKTLVVKMNDDATNNATSNTNYKLFVWCGNNYGINMCVAYVGSSAQFKQACSKQLHFHTWFYFNCEVVLVWDLHHVCGSWKTIFLKSISGICGFGDIQKWYPMCWMVDWFRITCGICWFFLHPLFVHVVKN